MRGTGRNLMLLAGALYTAGCASSQLISSDQQQIPKHHQEIVDMITSNDGKSEQIFQNEDDEEGETSAAVKKTKTGQQMINDYEYADHTLAMLDILYGNSVLPKRIQEWKKKKGVEDKILPRWQYVNILLAEPKYSSCTFDTFFSELHKEVRCFEIPAVMLYLSKSIVESNAAIGTPDDSKLLEEIRHQKKVNPRLDGSYKMRKNYQMQKR